MDRDRVRQLNADRLAGLEPATRRLALMHIAACEAEGIELLVVQGQRSMEEQAALYARGRTVPGTRVTNAPPGRSWHNFGRAYDVAVVECGRIIWGGPKYHRAGRIGSSLGLVWGGEFRSLRGDLGHFEYHPGLTLVEALAVHEGRMQMDPKKWYTSKTLWVNAVAIAAIVVQGITGREVLGIETQGVILGVVNMALRLITRSEVAW